MFGVPPERPRGCPKVGWLCVEGVPEGGWEGGREDPCGNQASGEGVGKTLGKVKSRSGRARRLPGRNSNNTYIYIYELVRD